MNDNVKRILQRTCECFAQLEQLEQLANDMPAARRDRVLEVVKNLDRNLLKILREGGDSL